MNQATPSDIDRFGRAAGEALNRLDYRAARALFERVLASRPADGGAWFGLALACRGIGDDAAHLAALDKVLAAEPGHLPALIVKADHFALIGDGRSADSFYRAVVNRAPPLATLPPDLRQEVMRAQTQCALYAKAFESHLQAAVADAGYDPRSASRRFTQSLDLLLGKKAVFLQAPTSYYFPELPQRQFYEREEFPWLPALEARTDQIRDELLRLISDDAAFPPYVRSTSLRPATEFHNLQDNPDWGALYLIEGGTVCAEAQALFPVTMEALRGVPLCECPGRTPSVLFSRLKPATRIPPHHGQINARLICHLPLVVPRGCGLRVGNETRPWIEGEALIFDDTIEHEAWNDSDQLRVVLLFEIWRPELTMDERALVAATLASVGSYRAG